MHIQQIRQQSFKPVLTSLADFILAHKNEIIKLWSSTIYKEINIKVAFNLTHSQLVEPFSQIIDGLAELLTLPSNVDTTPIVRQSTYLHGRSRFQQGYAIDELLQELGILRVIILEYIDESAGRHLNVAAGSILEARKLIHKLLNNIILASAQQFSEGQKLESQQYRKKLEETNLQLENTLNELKASEERFRVTFENAAVGIAHLSPDGQWLLVNRKLCNIIGYSSEELTKLNFQDITYPDDLKIDFQYINRMLSGEINTYSIEKRYIRKNGLPVWISLIVSLVRDSSNAPKYFITIVKDITDRKRLESELQEKAAEAINANRAKDEIISIISHELRTPLTAALGWARLLQTGKLDQATAEQAVAVIERNIRAQERLVNDLLDVGRMITGKMAVDVGNVELIKVIEGSLETVGPFAEEKNIKIETKLDQMISPISGDPHRLQQVLLNLLTNAVKFTPNGGKIRVELSQTDSYVEISVIDSGKGIGPDFLPYVFDRFRQEESSNKGKRGLGLGLPIASHIVKLHGGTINVESKGIGHGATFTVRLPKESKL
jgi:PAS domain S-box-containing protein